METLHFNDLDFTKLSLDVLESHNDGVLYAIYGNFPNCFTQCLFMVTFDENYGREPIDFFFNRLSLAKEFLHRFNKHHSIRYYRNRFENCYSLSYVLHLLNDDSINKIRFESPNRQKMIDFYASCISEYYRLVPTKDGYYLESVEESRE